MSEWSETVRAELRDRGIDPTIDPPFVEELAQHLEDRYQASLAAGLDPFAARAAALQELDGSERLAAEMALRRSTRPASAIAPGGPMTRPLAGLWQDAKYAARTLRRSPAFTIAAVVTVAISTGPTIAALGVANWLYFRPTPGVQAADRLGILWFGRWSENRASFSPSRVSYQHLEDMQRTLTTTEGVAGYQRSTSVNLSSDVNAPRVIEAQFVTANYFDLLGVRMAKGRGFRADEDREAGGSSVVVLSHGLARTLFADTDAVGRSIRINGHLLEIIGVAPPAFEGAVTGDRPVLWLPGRATPRITHSPPERWAYGADQGPFYEFLVRLRPGATFTRAQSEWELAARRLLETGQPATTKYQTVVPTVFPGVGLDPFARDSMKPFARLLVGVAVVLAALAAANLVNLFMFRGSRRLHEAALRRSLGASAARLAQLHVVEAVFVSGAGVLLGVALVAAGRGWLNGLVMPGIGLLEVAIDWRLVAVSAAMALLIGVLLGGIPARAAVRRGLTSALPSSQRTATTAGGRFRTGLAIAQLALSLTLLVGGLLFVETLRNLRGVNLGFNPTAISTFSFALRGQAYDAARTREFYRQLVERVGASPGVQAVSAATGLPMMSRSGFRVLPPDVAALEGKSSRELFDLGIRSLVTEVTPGYFRALEMRLVFGRTFTESEAYTAGMEPGVVISEALADRLFGTRNAVGRLVSFPGQGSLARHDAPVIGVVNDVRWNGPRDPADFMVYRPFGDLGPSSLLIVRSTLPRADVRRLVLTAVAGIDGQLPVQFDLTMDQIFSRRVAQQQIFAWVLGVLAALGFVLASVGIHGLVAQGVIERLREFGIRLAIGASRGDIVRLVIRQAAVIVAIGAPLGLLLSGLASRLIEAQLFGIAPLAPGVYAAAAGALGVAVFVALIGPVRRALAVDPVEAMRTE
jgi:predicted permease